MNPTIPAAQYVSTVDYALAAATSPIPVPVLIAAGLVCGAVCLIGLVWLLTDDRRSTRARKIAAAECRHPAVSDWGHVEPLSDGWWVCVCPNPRCQAKFEMGHIFRGPGQGRNLNVETIRAEYRQWNHSCVS